MMMTIEQDGMTITIEQGETTIAREPSRVEIETFDKTLTCPLTQYGLDMWYSVEECGWCSPEPYQLAKLTFRCQGAVSQFTGLCRGVTISPKAENEQDNSIMQVYEQWLVTAV